MIHADFNTESVISRQRVPVKVSQSPCVYACSPLLWALAGKGKSAASNDEPLFTYLYDTHKPTRRHLNTYLSLGQFNALDVREY